jgi:hypothetical protein
MSLGKTTDHIKRIRLLDRNERLISWCSKKKMGWYLREGIVKKIGDDTIQFLVETTVDDKEKHPESLTYKDCCVVCGSKKELSTHHVVPYSFVEFFPNDWKEYCEHDAVYLCIQCHEKYEELAYDFRFELLNKYGIDPRYDKTKGNAIAAANTLVRNKSLPADVQKKLLARAAKFLGKDTVSKDELRALSKRKIIESNEERPSARLVHKLTDIGEFCVLWRKHFVTTMNPLYLPNGWDINYDRTSKGLLEK